MSSSKLSSAQIPPLVELEDGCEALHELPFQIGSGRSLFAQDSSLRLKLFKRKSDQHLRGRVWFGDGADGPPGHAHGGAIAYVLDEAMGSVAWANAYPVVAAGLQFEYMQMTPLEVDLTIETWVEKVAGRRLHVEARLSLPDGRVCVNGHGQFAILARGRVQKLFASIVGASAGQHWLAHPFKWAPDDAE